MLRNNADAHISSLGYLWCNERALWFELQSELFVDLNWLFATSLQL